MEYALQAELEYVFAQGGGVPAYGSIVGGGANACILHYIDNDQPLQAGDLVLIDAGAELGHYAADITRTFPVSGRFSAEQKALYELVLDAQLEAIRWVQVGQHCKVYHEKAVEVLTAGLVRLGLLSGEVSALIESGAYRRFYMHGTGHWLGMDVHDAGAYKVDGQWRPLQAGMVVTVEPGLYVAADDDTVAPRWRGIGIRIEDDVLVTEQGPRVLTAGVPKQVGALEALIQGIPSLGD
jgi:Xaa-Pro aminopeptidase